MLIDPPRRRMTKRKASVKISPDFESLGLGVRCFMLTSLLEVIWDSMNPGAGVLDRMPFPEGKTSAQKDGSYGTLDAFGVLK